jgi:curved DNA-binding protein CbpA
MDARLRSRIEIETLHELLPSLNYYQILCLKQECPQSDIDTAFRGESRRLHPDRHAAGAAPDFRQKVNEVFKAVNDAYRVLRDPDARARYDQELILGEIRMAEEARKRVEAEAAAKNDPSKAARTTAGEKYWKLALQCWQEKNFNGCVMQIKFALGFEPDNEVFKEWLAKANAAFEDQKRKTTNTYRIRIV